MMIMWIIIAVIAALLFWGIFSYNRLITARNDVRNAWSQIDIQLKRRYDLIPNLVAAVTGYLDHERQILDQVILARSRALVTQRIPEKAVTEARLSREIKGLFAVMESYPVLRANHHVLRLQDELVSTENRIAFSRQLYNDLVANYLTLLQVFPDAIVASLFGFTGAEYFSASAAECNTLPAAAAQQ